MRHKKASNWRIGFYLAIRQLKHASVWTTSLIVLVMMLTFLNLVVVNGILVGLIQSSIQASKDRYTGDVIVSTLRQKTAIENSTNIEQVLKNIQNTEYVIPRTLASGKIEADYRRILRSDETPNQAAASIAGINPSAEDAATGLSKFVIEGNYLDDNDKDGVLVGAFLVNELTPIDVVGFPQLRQVHVGDRVRVSVGK
ncbi:MAG: hypothetical protein RJB39_491, partial [Candidatus Parcubacteria bacterium]